MNTPMRCAPCSSASTPANSKMFGASVCPSMKTTISPSCAPFAVVKVAWSSREDNVDWFFVMATPPFRRGSRHGEIASRMPATPSPTHNHSSILGRPLLEVLTLSTKCLLYMPSAVSSAPSLEIARSNLSPFLSMNVTSFRSTTQFFWLSVACFSFQNFLSSLTHGPASSPCRIQRLSVCVSVTVIFNTFGPLCLPLTNSNAGRSAPALATQLKQGGRSGWSAHTSTAARPLVLRRPAADVRSPRALEQHFPVRLSPPQQLPCPKCASLVRAADTPGPRH